MISLIHFRALFPFVSDLTVIHPVSFCNSFYQLWLITRFTQFQMVSGDCCPGNTEIMLQIHHNSMWNKSSQESEIHTDSPQFSGFLGWHGRRGIWSVWHHDLSLSHSDSVVVFAVWISSSKHSTRNRPFRLPLPKNMKDLDRVDKSRTRGHSLIIKRHTFRMETRKKASHLNEINHVSFIS